VGCVFKGKLVRLLSLGVGRHFEPQRNRGASCKTMLSIVRRVAVGLAAAVRDKAAREAEELCASGQCAAAVVPLQRAIDLGHLPSRALMAWLLIDGREGVALDCESAFELAEEGARLGCRHCQGVMAYCYWGAFGCEKDYTRSLELALESSGMGSKYGQVALGELHYNGEGGLAVDFAQAAAFYRMAAAQGLDAAQLELGGMHHNGDVIAQDYAEALRLFQLAAAQGHPVALYSIAVCYEHGHSVAADVAEAIRWYRRARAAGDAQAAAALQQLDEMYPSLPQ
jgi:TPR repeat protein